LSNKKFQILTGKIKKKADFHGQFKKKILVSGISQPISKIFSKGGCSHPPTPLPTPMARPNV
jgi:hypothetical protein